MTDKDFTPNKSCFSSDNGQNKENNQNFRWVTSPLTVDNNAVTLYEIIHMNGLNVLRVEGLKSVRIRSYSGPHFPAFGLNTEKYGVSLRIQSKCGKVRTKITPNTYTFYAVVGVFRTSVIIFWCCQRKFKSSFTLEFRFP